MYIGIKKNSDTLSVFWIFWSDLVGDIGFLEAVDMDELIIYSRNDFKGSLTIQLIWKV